MNGTHANSVLSCQRSLSSHCIAGMSSDHLLISFEATVVESPALAHDLDSKCGIANSRAPGTVRASYDKYSSHRDLESDRPPFTVVRYCDARHIQHESLL